MLSSQHRELAEPPSDCVSRVRFAPGSDLLLASSWDRVSSSLCLRSRGPIAYALRLLRSVLIIEFIYFLLRADNKPDVDSTPL